MSAVHRDTLARTAAVHPGQAPTYLYFAMPCRCLLLQLHFRDDRLLEAIAQQAQRKAAILTPHDISQLASAYARLSFPHPQLLQLLNSQAVAKASGFAPWVLVHTAWALHMCGQDVGLLLQEAVPLLQGRVGELKELDVSTLLWLMAGACMYVCASTCRSGSAFLPAFRCQQAAAAACWWRLRTVHVLGSPGTVVWQGWLLQLSFAPPAPLQHVFGPTLDKPVVFCCTCPRHPCVQVPPCMMRPCSRQPLPTCPPTSPAIPLHP